MYRSRTTLSPVTFQTEELASRYTSQPRSPLSPALQGAVPDGFVGQEAAQIAPGVIDDVAVHVLIDRVEHALGAVGPGPAPAPLVGVAGAQEEGVHAGGVFHLDLGQADVGVGVGGVEHLGVAVFADVVGLQYAAHHGAVGGALLGVAGHGLIDHDVAVLVVVGGSVVALQEAVVDVGGIPAFKADGLGVARGHGGVGHGDVRHAVDGGRAGAQRTVGDIGAAVDHHDAAAPIGADGSGGATLGGDGAVSGVERSAAGHHNAAGAAGALGGDGGVLQINGGVSVGEDAVGAAGLRLHGAAPDGQVRGGGFVLGIGKYAGVDAVKAGVVPIEVAGRLGDGGISQRSRDAGTHPQGDLRVIDGIREGLPGIVSALQLRDRVAGIEPEGAAAGRRGRGRAVLTEPAGGHPARRRVHGGGGQGEDQRQNKAETDQPQDSI